MRFRQFRLAHGESYILPESGYTRWLLAGHDLCFIVAGVWCVLAKSNAVKYLVPHLIPYIWAAFYTIGGILCLGAVIKRNPIGKVLGLPLLASASALYGACILLQYQRYNDGAYLIISTLLIGQACNLIGRWIGAMRLFHTIQEARISEGQG
jgi:hypothetical protein